MITNGDMPNADLPEPASPLDFLKPSTKYVSEEIKEARMDICRSCEFFNKFGVCRKCGCVMVAKTSMKHSFCPVHKWLNVE